MREARIILPVLDNNGATLAHVHTGLKRSLCEAFGGYTALASQGGWLDSATGRLYEEAGIAYDVAVNPIDATHGRRLRAIAAHAAREASQVCVYLRLPNGDVEFVEPDKILA